MNKVIFKIVTVILTFMFMSSCNSDSYIPVDDIKECETYNILSVEYGGYIIQNQVCEIRIYKHVNKVTMFNSRNHSKCTIYKKKNFVDKSSEIKKASNGQEYRIYDIEFDLVISQEGEIEKLEHYEIYIDMNPVPTEVNEGKYKYGKREIIITSDDGSSTVIDENSKVKVQLQLVESTAAMSI